MSVHFTSHRQNWKTPKAFYAELDKEFRFDFDPCPPDPQFDGLARGWGGSNFVNPPYNECAAWLKKGFTEWQQGKTVVFLIPSRTDTKFWHEYCMQATEIRFIKGRLKFDDQKNSAPFPSALVIFKGDKIKSCDLIKQQNKGENSMGLEQDIKRIADAVEIIAAHITSKTTAAPAKPEKEPKAPKAAAGADAGAGPAAAEVQPAASTEKVTEQVLREELRQYIVRHETKGKNKGMDAAAELLKKYNAKTVSTIKPEDYAAIVAHCREDKKKYDAATGKK